MKRIPLPVRSLLQCTGPSLGRRRDRRPVFPALLAAQDKTGNVTRQRTRSRGSFALAADSCVPLGAGRRAVSATLSASVAGDDVLLERRNRTLVLVLRRDQVPAAEDQRDQDRQRRVVDQRRVEPV